MKLRRKMKMKELKTCDGPPSDGNCCWALGARNRNGVVVKNLHEFIVHLDRDCNGCGDETEAAPPRSLAKGVDVLEALRERYTRPGQGR